MNSFPGVPFQRFQARQLLRDKYVLIIGDSVQRGVYKGKFTLNHQNKALLKNRFIVLSYSRKHKDGSFEWPNFSSALLGKMTVRGERIEKEGEYLFYLNNT